jgi:ATP-binding cassette subfamily B protein
VGDRAAGERLADRFLERCPMIHRIRDLIKPRRGLLLAGLAFKILEALSGIVPILTFYLLLKATVEDRTPIVLTTLVSILVAALLAEAVANYAAARLCYAAGFAMLAELRMKLAEHLRRLPLGFFTTRTIGDVATALTRDIKTLDMLPTHLLGELVAAISLSLSLLVMLIIVNWRLALAALAGLPLGIIAMIMSQRRLQIHTAERAEAAADASARIMEYGRGIAVLRMLGLHGEHFPQLEAVLRRSRDANLALIRRVGATGFSYVASIELGFPAILLAGGALWSTGGTSIADLLLFLLTTMRLLGPVQKLMEIVAMLRLCDAAMIRIERIFAEPALPEPSASSNPAQPKDNGFELSDVSFGYDRQPVLQNISLKLPPGTLAALVGASGVGKSTLAHLLARFWDVEAGRILLGGVDVRSIPTEQLLSRMAMVFQTVHLFEGSIADNISISRPGASSDEIEAAARAARCHEMIMQLPRGYDTPVGDDGYALSGGERQRLAIARAILKDAPIVILDEATASLDPETERDVQDAISALVSGRTVVVIAHRLQSVIGADQIIVLENGRVSQTGTHADLRRQKGGTYARLWDIYEAGLPAN